MSVCVCVCVCVCVIDLRFRIFVNFVFQLTWRLANPVYNNVSNAETMDMDTDSIPKRNERNKQTLELGAHAFVADMCEGKGICLTFLYLAISQLISGWDADADGVGGASFGMHALALACTQAHLGIVRRRYRWKLG